MKKSPEIECRLERSRTEVETSGKVVKLKFLEARKHWIVLNYGEKFSKLGFFMGR